MTKKIFVLDTSVIIYDHNSINNFDEHDVVLPITVLEELDEFKKGNSTKNYEAREFIRLLDKLTSENENIQEWTPLGNGKGSIKVILNAKDIKTSAIDVYSSSSMDNKILNAALKVKQDSPERVVIMVTKDVNLRLKAKALGLRAEDYETGKVKNIDNLSSGIHEVQNFDQQLIDTLYSSFSIHEDELPDDFPIFSNGYYILQGTKSSALGYFNPFERKLERVNKSHCYNIKPRNAEQAFAMHAVLKPEIKLCAIHGVAGTGKTLLTLAAALEQRREFKQIYLARPIVPLSNKDLGYLPGDIKSKIDPYMQPLWDNLKFIQNQFEEQEKEHKQISQMLEQDKLHITPLAYIRGRSLSNVIFIVDEAQNLTPHEIKTIVTRAGENSKFVFTGDIKQIDTPYLDEQSNGLSYIVDRIIGRDLFTHVRLSKGERSELANLANELL